MSRLQRKHLKKPWLLDYNKAKCGIQNWNLNFSNPLASQPSYITRLVNIVTDWLICENISHCFHYLKCLIILLVHQNGHWSWKFCLSIVNAVMPNQTRYICIAAEGVFSHKDAQYSLLTSIFWNSLFGGYSCPCECPNRTQKDCFFSQKAHFGVLIPLISCFASASPRVESDLENYREKMPLVELPAKIIWISHLEYLFQTHLSYIQQGTIIVFELCKEQ